MVNPHVESHLAIKSRSCDETFIDELSFNDCLWLDHWKLTLLNLLQDSSLIVFLIDLFLVNWSVDLEVYKLIAHKIVLKNFFSVFLGRVLLGPELQNILRGLSIVVHLQLVRLCKMWITLAEFLQINSILVGDT